MYEILGVPKDANLSLIKSVYRSLGQIYHPDKYKGNNKSNLEKIKKVKVYGKSKKILKSLLANL